MAKDLTSIRIDENIKRRAKEKGLNISAEVERALRIKLFSTKKDLPERKVIVKCCKCDKVIKEGYHCIESSRIWCNPCHLDLNIAKICKPYHIEVVDKQGSYKIHEHIFWREHINNRPIEAIGFIGKKDEYLEDRNERFNWGFRIK